MSADLQRLLLPGSSLSGQLELLIFVTAQKQFPLSYRLDSRRLLPDLIRGIQRVLYSQRAADEISLLGLFSEPKTVCWIIHNLICV